MSQRPIDGEKLTGTAPVKKQRNALATKARILSVAQKAFANRGYSQTGLRDIARGAEVAPSLLMRHFGSKQELFREALLYGIETADYTDIVFKGSKDGFGERLVRLALNEAEIDISAMMMLSTGDEDARAVTAEIAREQIMYGMAKWLGPPNAYARAFNIVMLMNGFILFTKQLPLGDVPAHSIQWLESALQAIVDEGRPDDAAET